MKKTCHVPNGSTINTLSYNDPDHIMKKWISFRELPKLISVFTSRFSDQRHLWHFQWNLDCDTSFNAESAFIEANHMKMVPNLKPWLLSDKTEFGLVFARRNQPICIFFNAVLLHVTFSSVFRGQMQRSEMSDKRVWRQHNRHHMASSLSLDVNSSLIQMARKLKANGAKQKNKSTKFVPKRIPIGSEHQQHVLPQIHH